MQTGRQAEQRRDVAGEGVATGLVIYRASRLEDLVPPLAGLLQVTWPENPLESQTIIAAHPAMRQWLTGELARRTPRGVVANIEVVLASSWIERQAQQRLAAQAVSLPRYRRQQLRWVIHGLLGDPARVAGFSDARVAAYLAALPGKASDAAGQAIRRFQLADRLAAQYSRYLVYRPDWLRSWEQGRFDAASRGDAATRELESRFLGPLWRHIADRLGEHRGGLVARLVRALRDDPQPRQALHVFGLSHLPDSELAVLRAYSETALVALYAPDPCREFWGGLRQPLHDYRQAEQLALDQAGEGDYWRDQDHPLLARWGRLGQHFFSALADQEGQVLEDVRHWRDQQETTGGNRLQRLQSGIRMLSLPAVSGRPEDAEWQQSERYDASLRVHACHTRLRELEVLRDALLDAQQQDAIRPGEMVVMAPDIQAYLPLIPAVFGEPGDARERLLPYHLADVPVARSHRLFTALRRLLDLPTQRISAPEVLDLLAMPEIQRRFGLDADAVDTLGEWLRQSRVAWALDAEHRASFGVPALSEHSFAWAMDRLLAGYLMSDAAEGDRECAVHLPDGTELLPISAVQGNAAEALGALDGLLQELQAWSDLAGSTCPASEWAQLLDTRLDALFRIDRRDAAAREAWDALKRFVRSLETEALPVHENPLLHFAVVRELLVERLDSVPERQRFLLGGITFCGMVPQRAIPFRLVAVLGLAEGEFPRGGSDGGIDLMSRLRRVGDRDVRSDDRYLFLETLMSARSRLHLSFIGEGVKDGKPRNPAAPLAELIAELDREAGLTHDSDAALRPWLVRHPLQPFDARYFSDEDPRLFSYSQRYAGMQSPGQAGSTPAALPFLQASALPPDALPLPMSLAELSHFYRDPARNLLERRLKLRLDALDEDRLSDTEPLEARIERLASVARRLFFDTVLPQWFEGPDWQDGVWQPAQAPDWIRLGGLLPTGRLGEAAWQAEVLTINALAQAAHDSGLVGRESARLGSSADIDLALDLQTGMAEPVARLTGRVAWVFPLELNGHQGLQILRVFPASGGKPGALKTESELHFGERVPMFIDWTALRLQSARNHGAAMPVRITSLVKGAAPWCDAINAWDARWLAAEAGQADIMLDDLRQRLRRLLGWWQAAQQRPELYFPRSSWMAVAGDDQQEADHKLVKRIRDVWAGGNRATGERDFGAGYSRLLGGELHFEVESDDLHDLQLFAYQLKSCISLDAGVVEAVA